MAEAESRFKKRKPTKPQKSDKGVCEIALAAHRQGKRQDECAKLAGVCDYQLRLVLARNPVYREQWDAIVTERRDAWKQKFLDALNSGLSLTRASTYIGVPENNIRDELKRDDVFREMVEQADAGFEKSLLERIKEGKPGWQGSAWLAERKYRKVYAPPKMDFGDNGDERVVKVRRMVGAAVQTLKRAASKPADARPEPETAPDVLAASA